jgi:GT2 family glycosyltransferase
MRVLMADLVVVDYRTPDDLAGFLDSFHEHAGDDDHLTIVLVDPTAECRRVAAWWETHPAVREVVVHATNVGYGVACNHAAAAGDADIVAFFNADTRLTAGVTEACVAALRSRDDWAIVGPRQVDDRGRLTHSGIFGTNRSPVFGDWLRTDRGQCSAARDDAISVSGSAYFIKRSVWEELAGCSLYRDACRHAGLAGLGAFLESPLYYEDMWCSVHARSHGHKVAYVGEVVMTHRWHKAVAAAGTRTTRQVQSGPPAV